MPWAVTWLRLIDKRISSTLGGIDIPHKILVADDDESFRQFMTQVLSSRAFRVTAVANGRQAVEEVTRGDADMLISDIQMPDFDGRDLCRFVKSRPETKNMPVVLVSGLTDIRDPATSVGADGFMQKPFSLDDLFALINRLLSAKMPSGCSG